MLYVTHDQTEALTLADRIVCMSMGRVQQIGTPLELYDTPANLFVASFIGLPPMNFFTALVSGDTLITPHFTIGMTPEQKELLADYQGKHVTLGVRPEDIYENGSVPVTVSENENLGMNTLVHGHMGDGGSDSRITCKFKGWCDYKKGDVVKVTFNKMHFFDQETQNRITKA